jgi:hypothetical protein
VKVNYDNVLNVYSIKIEYPETEIHLSAENVVEAREIFIQHMAKLFDDAANDKLKD